MAPWAMVGWAYLAAIVVVPVIIGIQYAGIRLAIEVADEYSRAAGIALGVVAVLLSTAVGVALAGVAAMWIVS